MTIPVSDVPSPTDLSATATNISVSLSWTEPVVNKGPPIKEYNIYRGENSSDYSLISTTSSTSYDDTTVETGKTYYYWVTAVDNKGESLPSNVIVITVKEGSSSEAPLNPVPVFLGFVVMVVMYSRYQRMRKLNI